MPVSVSVVRRLFHLAELLALYFPAAIDRVEKNGLRGGRVGLRRVVLW